MTQVWNKVREVDPNDAEAVKDAVNTFFNSVTKIGDQTPIKWLRVLGDVLNRFPKYCMSHRGTIESLLKTSIDSNDYYYVIEAAKCAQSVQQVRPSQEKTATPKTLWQEQMSLLCNAAHSLISAIFPNAVDMYKDVKNKKKQESSPNSLFTSTLLNIRSIANNEKKDDKISLLQIRLRNVFCFIQAMLVEVYPVAKPIQPQNILDVVVRAISVSGGTKNLDVDVSVVKIEALRTLDALIACLGSNLIPFSPLVFRLLMQTFRWSSENPGRDSSKVRCTAYNSLSNWLNTLHCHRTAADSRSSWEDDLTTHILNDTAPMEKVVQLTMGPPPTKHMSKKAKRKLANARLLESSIASHMPGEKNKILMPEEINNEVAMAALGCAETFLLVCGRFLKPTTHKLLQERMIRECYNAHRYGEDMLILFLHVAEASRKTAPSGVPPPTQHCLQLYSVLGNTAHGEISKFCTQALLDIRLHLHCSPPSLNFALEMPQEKQVTTTKRKKVSEKNRMALEALLGTDRMPQLDEQVDVITIPDEPSSKKQRIDNEQDKISVSSDSLSSVEISDDSDIEEIPMDKQESEVNGEKEKASVDTCTLAVEKSFNGKGSDVTDNNIKDIIDSTEVKQVNNAASEEEKSEKTALEDFEKTEVDAAIIIHSEPSEEKDINNEDNMNQENFSIHEAPTLIPLNISTETIYEEGPLSMEIAYDDPNNDHGTINTLNKVDDEILTSTNETDDVTITCGQLAKSSQDIDLEKKSDDTDLCATEVNDVSKTNGDVCGNVVIKNGADIPSEKAKDVDMNDTKVKDSTVSIEDMMADFVDEVNDDDVTVN